jgi:hypothetical protein
MDLLRIIEGNGEEVRYTLKETYIVKNKQYISKDFKTDGCTGISDRIFGFDFSDACKAHDGFYRNVFDGTRLQADRIFYSAMLEVTRKQAKNPFHQFLGQCTALWRYTHVRVFGWLAWRPDGKESYLDKGF